MSKTALIKKIALAYGRALFDLSIEKNTMHKITADFYNLKFVFKENFELIEYLNNPAVVQKAKREVLTKLLKSKLNTETFKFLMLVVDRDRINIISAIINSYFELIYQAALIKDVEVSTASFITNSQTKTLIKKLEKLTNANKIELVITLDRKLIGGFLIKTESKVIDFTVKNQLQKLAKHLNTVLKI